MVVVTPVLVVRDDEERFVPCGCSTQVFVHLFQQGLAHPYVVVWVLVVGTLSSRHVHSSPRVDPRVTRQGAIARIFPQLCQRHHVLRVVRNPFQEQFPRGVVVVVLPR